MKKFVFIVLLMGCILDGFTQENPDFLNWSSLHKLSIHDFGIKRSNSNSNLSFAQFSIDYKVSGLDFMTKNFNKKVKNQMIKSASWIDTTQFVEISLRYQQTLFNLAEIQVRKFRKDLKENRKLLAKGLTIVEELNSKNSVEFAKRRIEYDLATNSGTDDDNQLKWEEQIKRELSELSEFEFDK